MIYNIKKLVGGGGTKSSIKSSACISSKQILHGGLLFSNCPYKESRCLLLNRHRERL